MREGERWDRERKHVIQGYFKDFSYNLLFYLTYNYFLLSLLENELCAPSLDLFSK